MCQVLSEKHSLWVTRKVARVLQTGLRVVQVGYVAPTSLLPDGWVGSWERKRRWSGRGQHKQEGQCAPLTTSSGDGGNPPLGAALIPGPGPGAAAGRTGPASPSAPVHLRLLLQTKLGVQNYTDLTLCQFSGNFYYLYFYLFRLSMKL